MLIQVTTTHGRKFRRCGITFGPIPVRLWHGDGEPPRGVARVSTATLERLAQATGDLGPLHIEYDVAPARTAGADAAELAALRAELADRTSEAERMTAELARATGEVAALRAQVAGLEGGAGEVEALRAQVAGLESTAGEVEALRARVTELEGAAGEVEALHPRVAELDRALASEKQRTADLQHKADDDRKRRRR